MNNIIGTPEGRRLAEELKKQMHRLQQETGFTTGGRKRVIRYWLFANGGIIFFPQHYR